MNLPEYLKDRCYVLMLNLAGLFFLSMFLFGVGIQLQQMLLIWIIWMLVLLLYFGTTFYVLRRRFREMEETLMSLDKRYLFAEIAQPPKSLEGQQHYRILRKAYRSMLEEVGALQSAQKDYQEYIEQWIHEIKVPITSAKLICHNRRSETTHKLMPQLERIDAEVERALFYARSDTVHNDYLIREAALSDIVSTVISRNKQLLIDSKVRLEQENLHLTVNTDTKWIEFILNQIVSNAVKYRKAQPVIVFSAQQEKEGICLSVTDNGVGIASEELGRIFQKGFTGSNGRQQTRSTGIGLYLCKKLCKKLAIGITAHSVLGESTTIELFFPKGRFLSKM